MSNLPEPVSFAAAQEKFINHLKSQTRSSATIIAYASDLEQLRTYMESHRITQVTTVQTEHLQDYIQHLASQSYTPKSISRKINSLKTFFKFLQQQQLIPANPALPLTHPKYETKPPKVLTPEEYRALRDVSRLDIRISAIIELLLQTGMRISELANLHVEDVKKNEVYIRSQENNPARTVPLDRPAVSAVQNYLSLRPQVTNEHLFVTKTGHPLLVRNIRTSIDRYFKKANLPDAKVNDLRHTFIAYQLSHGVKPEIVNKVVGHKRMSSTEKYFDYVKVTAPEPSSKIAEL
jgi:site-specific recombinase XerD